MKWKIRAVLCLVLTAGAVPLLANRGTAAAPGYGKCGSCSCRGYVGYGDYCGRCGHPYYGHY